MANETPPPTSPQIDAALQKEDPVALAQAATVEQMERLKAAEAVIEARYQRKKRGSRIAFASQVIVGWVALAGFFVNAYQSHVNKVSQQKQAELDQQRWNREFERAQQADKYRAFFETSALATDTANRDKRLVGYALLQEFVEDKDYNSKAMLMLEEKLAQEMETNNNKEGLDEAHRNAVTAILTALSETRDCRALQRAALSIDKIAKRYSRWEDIEETRGVFKVYVRTLVGRAAQVCVTMKDFRGVRRPIRDTLIKIPDVDDLKPPVTPLVANARIMGLLRNSCLDEMNVSGATDCGDVFLHYLKLCAQTPDPKDAHEVKDAQDEQRACQETNAAVASGLGAKGPATGSGSTTH